MSGRFSCTCPECGATNFDDDYTKSLVEIQHKKDCLYAKGNLRVKFKIVDTQLKA